MEIEPIDDNDAGPYEPERLDRMLTDLYGILRHIVKYSPDREWTKQEIIRRVQSY